jgi:hypothetical protein
MVWGMASIMMNASPGIDLERCHALTGLALVLLPPTQGVALGWYVWPFQGRRSLW